jgi:hypothetical protein
MHSRAAIRAASGALILAAFAACADSTPADGGADLDADTGRGSGRDIEPLDAASDAPEPDAVDIDTADASADTDAAGPDAADTLDASTDAPDDADTSPDAETDVPAPDASDAAEVDAADTDALTPIGEPCEESPACETALCVNPTGGDEPGVCSSACDDDDACPEGFSCYELTLDGVAVLGVCLPDLYCSDRDLDGYGKGPGCIDEDCDDDNDTVYPGAAEICDTLDNDCDDDVDEEIDGLAEACDTGEDGICGIGAEVCSAAGTIDCVRSFEPTAEICDGVDNDCMGGVDDGLTCDPGPECTRVYGAWLCRDPGTYDLLVPAGVEDVIVIAWGAGGAGGSQGGGTGGGGGHVFAGGLAVESPETLRVIVGSGGRAEGGGGGASMVYRGPTLLAVAAGGGGGGSDGCSGCNMGGAGGAGGGAEGQAGGGTDRGISPWPFGFATGGGGGTALAGGTAGTTGGSTAGSTCLSDGEPGADGLGGRGGGGRPDCMGGAGGGAGTDGGTAGWGNGSGGGGGAGYFGGGGGGGRYTYFGGGGGGGSSWAHPSLFTGTVTLVSGSGPTPGAAEDRAFYLGENARGGARGTSRDATTAGGDGVVAILMFPPPWM